MEKRDLFIGMEKFLIKDQTDKEEIFYINGGQSKVRSIILIVRNKIKFFMVRDIEKVVDCCFTSHYSTLQSGKRLGLYQQHLHLVSFLRMSSIVRRKFM